MILKWIGFFFLKKPIYCKLIDLTHFIVDTIYSNFLILKLRSRYENDETKRYRTQWAKHFPSQKNNVITTFIERVSNIILVNLNRCVYFTGMDCCRRLENTRH